MKPSLLILMLCSVLSLPALAQETPMQTNLNPADGRKEMRNARGAQLTTVTPQQARANELKRCDPLPAFYKSDCIARINGQGASSGSVVGGGILMESVTTMPKTQLEAEMRDIGPVHLPRKAR